MKTVIIVALCICSIYAKQQYVDNEFIVRLNEKYISSDADFAEMTRYLGVTFNYETLTTYKVGKLRFMLVRGEERYVETLRSLPGALYVERNALGQRHVIETCEEQPSPGTWGLDRVDQREALRKN